MTLPSLSISVCRRTVPSVRDCRASCGYTGCTLLIADPHHPVAAAPRPWLQPRPVVAEVARRTNGANSTKIPPSTPPICPPGTPPTTPPVTVVAAPRSGGGASSPNNIYFLRDRFRRHQFTGFNQMRHGLHMHHGRGRRRGGDAAGGGGAVGMVARKLLGSAGVTSSGIISIRASSRPCEKTSGQLKSMPCFVFRLASRTAFNFLVKHISYLLRFQPMRLPAWSEHGLLPAADHEILPSSFRALPTIPRHHQRRGNSKT